VGDKLVTARFGQGLTGGFCAMGEPNAAVCLQPGTELAFEREIKSHRLLPPSKLGAQVARFWRANEAHRKLERLGAPLVLRGKIDSRSGKYLHLRRVRRNEISFSVGSIMLASRVVLHSQRLARPGKNRHQGRAVRRVLPVLTPSSVIDDLLLAVGQLFAQSTLGVRNEQLNH
jgi:hypothetical protein